MKTFFTNKKNTVSILALLILAACSGPKPIDTQKVTLFFYSQEDFNNAEFERPVPVIRQVPKEDEPKDAALKLLFAGPTTVEEDAGAVTSEDLTTLGDYYLGVSIVDTVATVNFESPALEILNSAAARQMMAKAPIEETVMQFGDVTEVQYAIDGQVFTEWDA